MSKNFMNWLNSNKVRNLKRPNKSVVDFFIAHLSEFQNPYNNDIEMILFKARLLEKELIEDAFYDKFQDAVTPLKK